MSARRPRARARGRRGQGLVEFAITAPVLLLMILGLIDFARAWNTFQVITDAAREGARECAINNGRTWDDVEMNVIVAALANAKLNLAAVTITPVPDEAACEATRPAPITIRIEYLYQLGWVGKLMAFTGGDDIVTLTTEFTMQNE